MNPREAIAIRGLRQNWVARMMGISEAYLSLLLDERRRWTGDLQRRFCMAIGIAESAICFASAGTSRGPVRYPPGTAEQEPVA